MIMSRDGYSYRIMYYKAGGGGTTSGLQSGKKKGGTAAMGRVYAEVAPSSLRIKVLAPEAVQTMKKPTVRRHYVPKRKKRPVEGFVDQKSKIKG
jgi:hypothetical protein